MFAPIWSARRHPIYQAIEVADEEQLMRLRPEIRQIIECNSVVARSGRSNQHQGLDAILEEVNKTLKTLIPPIPAQKHWEMAARNCTKFMKVRINIINIKIYSILLLFDILNIFLSNKYYLDSYEKNCSLQWDMQILKVQVHEAVQTTKRNHKGFEFS